LAIRAYHCLYRLTCDEVRIIGETGVQWLLDGVRQDRWCYIETRRRRRLLVAIVNKLRVCQTRKDQNGPSENNQLAWFIESEQSHTAIPFLLKCSSRIPP